MLYHLNAGEFASGFFGVDVLFVITGYLMAATYNPQSKASFLAKRATRLLPADFTTILFTLAVSAMAHLSRLLTSIEAQMTLL